MAPYPHERRPAIFLVARFHEHPVDRRRNVTRRRAGFRRVQPEPHRFLEDGVLLVDHRRRLSYNHRATNLYEQPTDTRGDLADDDISGLDDSIRWWMQCLIMIVCYHHAEIILGS